MVIKKRLEIERIIDKGGEVAADKEQKAEWTNFTLRIKTEMSRKIDEVLKDSVGITKTGWILQAIHEKINKG